MRGAPAPEPWTVERALRELPPDSHWEIDEGRLEMREPPAFYHADATLALASRLRAFVRARGLGRVGAGDPGFYLAREPDTLRGPDVAFLSGERLRRIPDLDRFPEVPPDLAVEVLSPGDRRAEVRRKAAQYLALGVRSVWVVDPRARTLERMTGSGEVRRYTDEAEVVRDAVLPGFACPLGELLPDPEP